MNYGSRFVSLILCSMEDEMVFSKEHAEFLTVTCLALALNIEIKVEVD
jgi:hypothetical protein